jgi:hypothetical protein
MAIAGDGYAATRPPPRSFGQSSGPLEGLTMDDLPGASAMLTAASPW